MGVCVIWILILFTITDYSIFAPMRLLRTRNVSRTRSSLTSGRCMERVRGLVLSRLVLIVKEEMVNRL